MKPNIVIIAEKRVITENINILSVDLDFSSKNVTNKIINELEHLGFTVVNYSSPKEFLQNINRHQNDIVFSTLWGGEHSRNKRSLIAAICEAYHIKYIGADTYVQSLCQDKYLTKLYLKDFKFKIPKAILISSENEMNMLDNIDFYPCIVKPSNEGSSVGISDTSIAYNKSEAILLVKKIITKYNPIIVEELIGGREISICMAGTEKNLLICEAVELLVNGKSICKNIWGYESKKTGKSTITRSIVTHDIPAEVLYEAQYLFRSLEKVDLMRIDGKFINGDFYIIELSPDCSLHESCFMSTAFKQNGFTYSDMLNQLIQISNSRYI